MNPTGVTCGPINDYRQVFEDAQVRHRRLRVDLQRPDGKQVSTIASPLRLQGTPPVYDRAPPTLGDSTEQVLRELLGRSPESMAGYRESGII